MSIFPISLGNYSQKLPAFALTVLVHKGKQKQISLGKPSFTQPLQLPVHWLTWAPGREVHHQTHFDWTFPLKTDPVHPIWFSPFISLEAKFKQRQILAEKHLIALMRNSLLNTAALWSCLCCSDLVLFVDLFSFICFLSFDCVCVRVYGTMLYLGMSGMLGWAWVTFLDCIGSLVFAQEDGGAPYVIHAIGTPMHVLVRNGLPFHLCCFIRHFLTN